MVEVRWSEKQTFSIPYNHFNKLSGCSSNQCTYCVLNCSAALRKICKHTSGQEWAEGNLYDLINQLK